MGGWEFTWGNKITTERKSTHTHSQKKSLKFLPKEWRIQQSRSSCADRGEASLIYQLTSALFMGHQGEAERKEGDGESRVGGGNTEGLKYAWGLALLGARKKKMGKGERMRDIRGEWERERARELETV